MEQKTYFCIDMKAFYASVECAQRGLNPFETNLVVADASRGKGALCLAVSPKLKAQGVGTRCRLFEIPPHIKYIAAKPRMSKYIEYAADIYEIYLNYISKDDIHVYSIDESFIDATSYLKVYNLTPKQFAAKLVDEIAHRLHIPSTVGIGTNLYLAKIALDITAKKSKEHLGYLNEELYKATLWEHKPITDFWQVAKGTAARLARFGITDMKGVALAPEQLMYKTFGINAELLIDHAWGRESCTIADIKAYKTKSKSISNSQILLKDYTFEQASLVMQEMALAGCQQMLREGLVTRSIWLGVGYSKDERSPTSGSIRMAEVTNIFSIVSGYVATLFENTAAKNIPIRRLSISFGNLCGQECEGYDFFTNYEQIQREKKCEQAALYIKDKFGKNAMLRAMDLQADATAKLRNTQIGGHNSE